MTIDEKSFISECAECLVETISLLYGVHEVPIKPTPEYVESFEQDLGRRATPEEKTFFFFAWEKFADLYHQLGGYGVYGGLG